ncbi:DNA polymerase III subunit delta' [Acetobacter aceti]|uniref:DNA polymerase III subunit delta n=2 Tax=Acetobacter aceti TaxID=435 RepID=A0A1U9KG43_ACEAC|nr:DNA polymerase III subunit delta' [Acetobacter aceti]
MAARRATSAAEIDPDAIVSPMDAARAASLHVVGHDAAFSAFDEAFASGRLHHAWLLTGPAGIGKLPLAFRMARRLLGAEDGQSSAGRLVSAGSHPDLLAVGRAFDEKKQKFRGEIVADDIRPINAFMHRTAAEGGWRVVIVDTAEAMNRNAANALLKILEEPPVRAILILTSATPGALLPTIRSRVRRLPVAPLREGDVRAVLRATVPDAEPGEIERVVPLAEGSPGRAIALLADKGGAIDTLVHEAVQGMSTGRILDAAETLSRAGEGGFGLFFTLLGSAIAEEARAESKDGLHIGVRLADAWREVAEIRSKTENFNLDRQEAIIEALTVAGQTRQS